MRGIGLFLVPLIAALPLRAHLLSFLYPDEQLAKAAVVCNGTVLEVFKTIEKVTVTRINPPAVCDVWKARIKVLRSSKGDAKGEIELRYPRVAPPEPGARGIWNDESVHFDLKPGNRYRFYLNPSADGKAYVTVLDMQYDDLSAVESLDADEPDSSPPLLTNEARDLADAYFKKVRKDATIEVRPSRDYWIFAGRNTPGFMSNVWTVNYWYFPPPRNKRQFQVDAQIYVRGDRTIDPMTWISSRPAMKPGEISSADIGRQVRLDVAQVRHRFVRGQLESVTDRKIRLKDPRNEDDDSLADSGYFKRDVNEVWILEPVPK